MNYTIKNSTLSVSISTKGAEMQSIIYNNHEYLWQGDPAYWTDHSPVLFPFVGRFTNGQYTLKGQNYDMTIHGFAAASTFQVTKHTDTSITFTLTDSEETRKCYPYAFCFKVIYTVHGNQLLVTYQVTNLSDDTMYFGVGGHPGFKVPLEEGLDFTDYVLDFASAHTPSRVGHTEACFLSGIDADFPLLDGTKLPMHHDMFDEDAIVLKNMADKVTLRSDKGSRSVTVSYPDLPYLGIWHMPKTDAPYCCIEPWTSLPSRQDIIEDFQYKSDLVRLPAGQTHVNKWSITLE